MPAEQLRSVRIMLLKVTHFPYVAAIWVFERASRYMSREDKSWIAKSEPRLHKRPFIASPINVPRKAKQAALSSRSEASLAKMADADARPNASRTDEVSDLKQMMGMISKLSGQVTELTARLDQARS